MTASEFARLSRRVAAYDGSQRALADTVLDIKVTVDEHTATLDQHTATLDQHTGLLTEILRRLPEPPPGP